MTKYLLCRPQGGLNDLLSQIEKCCRYAEQTERTVVVDTNYAGSIHFNDHFENYFISRQDKLLLSPKDLNRTVDELSVFPEFLLARVNRYVPRQNPETHKFCDSENNLPITFDFTKNYPHQLLVHHQAGGSRNSIFALSRMQVQSAIADELQRRIKAIGGPYSAIHIRHTDYRTDYEQALANIKRSTVGRLFVATDNRQVLEDFQACLGYERVFSFSALPQTAGEPIHTQALSEAKTFARNQDAIIDLLMLALSRRLYLLKLRDNHLGTKASGFSRLAHNLWSSNNNGDGARFIVGLRPEWHSLEDPSID